MAAETAPDNGQERAGQEMAAGGHDATPSSAKPDGRDVDLQPGFVILLTALTALGPVSTDFYLPSLPNIARYFAVGEAEAQLTLSGFLICFAATMLVFGPLSDRFGRKPVMLGGLTIFTIASAACALAGSIDQLIIARMFQAIGAGAGPVISRAVVRDRFGAGGASRVLSYLAAAMTLAPAIGPILGGYLQERFGWQSIFWAISLYGATAVGCAAWRLPESHPPANRTSHGPIAMLRTYGMLLRHKRYVGFVLCQTFSYSGIFCFISGSSFVFINVLGVAPAHFGWCFSVFVIGYLIGTVLSTRLTHRIGIDGMVRLGSVVALAATVLLLLVAIFAPSVAGLLAPLMAYMIGIGLASPNSQAGAIGPFPKAAGAASSLLGFLQMSIAAGVGTILGSIEAQTAWPMALAILLTTCGLNLSYWLVVRPGNEGHPA